MKHIIWIIIALLFIQVPQLLAAGKGVTDCPYCCGLGEVYYGLGSQDCRHCNSTGRYEFVLPYIPETEPNSLKINRLCPVCEGCKLQPDHNGVKRCVTCEGNGYIKADNPVYENPIPRGGPKYNSEDKEKSIKAILAFLNDKQRKIFIEAINNLSYCLPDNAAYFCHGRTAREIVRFANMLED